MANEKGDPPEEKRSPEPDRDPPAQSRAGAEEDASNKTPPNPEEITDGDSLLVWLETRSPEDAAAIAFRAALRVAPIAFEIFWVDEENDKLTGEIRRRLILSLFRATVLASQLIVNPENTEIRSVQPRLRRRRQRRPCARAAANAAYAAAAAYAASRRQRSRRDDVAHAAAQTTAVTDVARRNHCPRQRKTPPAPPAADAASRRCQRRRLCCGAR